MDDINSLLASTYDAKLPWRTVDASGSYSFGKVILKGTFDSGDTQEQIDKCLSCTRLKCTNCLCENNGRKKTVKVLSGQISFEIMEIMEM